MTTLTAGLATDAAPPALNRWGYVERSRFSPLAFAPGTAMAAGSWLAGGMPILTDIAFVLLTLGAIMLLAIELFAFPRRFGVGAVVLYGGILIFFCEDYLSNWMGLDFNHRLVAVGPDVLAKASTLHGLFCMLAAAGLLLPVGRWPERLLSPLREPTDARFYMFLAVALFAFGMAPYFLFTRGGGFSAIYNAILGGRAYTAPWTVGRTGNLNYSWGAYVSQWLDIAKIGALLGAYYAIVLAREPLSRLIGAAMFGLQLALAFGTGSRSQTLHMAMPVLFLLYLKYQAIDGAIRGQRFSARAYLAVGVGLAVLLLLIQLQIVYRNLSFETISLQDERLLDVQGSNMFSEGLIGFSLMPEHQPFYYGRFPGQGLVTPMPVTAFYFAVGPIPRALWPGKPIDPVWAWYNRAYLGQGDGLTGTTIATGLVGHWYFRFGVSGVIQGALLFGLMLKLWETALQRAQGRTLWILIPLMLMGWQLTAFRGFQFHGLYPVLIGVAVLTVLIHLQRGMTARQV